MAGARMGIERRPHQQQGGVRVAILRGCPRRTGQQLGQRLASCRVRRLARGPAQQLGPRLRLGAAERLELAAGHRHALAQHGGAGGGQPRDLLLRQLDALQCLRQRVGGGLLLRLRQRRRQQRTCLGQRRQRAHRSLGAPAVCRLRHRRQLARRAQRAQPLDRPQRKLSRARLRQAPQLAGGHAGHDGQRVARGPRHQRIGILEQVQQRLHRPGRGLARQREAQRRHCLQAHRRRLPR